MRYLHPIIQLKKRLAYMIVMNSERLMRHGFENNRFITSCRRRLMLMQMK